CDQYIGLNEWASNRVLLSQVSLKESIGSIEGAWDAEVEKLHRYTLVDGTVYEEYVQATPWSSGPCYFIALKDAQGKSVSASLWSKKQLSKC
ncbi:MAG: hypothetical protein ACRD3W_25150, partial [Terriglobales bacterium]